MTNKEVRPSPSHGETVLHCGHPGAKSHHFYRCSEITRFTRPDGTTGVTEWLVACHACHVAARGDPRRVDMRGDGVWQGDEPISYRPDLRVVPSEYKQSSLVDAAPDLLAACEAVIFDIDNEDGRFEGDAIDLVRKAIAKAKGTK